MGTARGGLEQSKGGWEEYPCHSLNLPIYGRFSEWHGYILNEVPRPTLTSSLGFSKSFVSTIYEEKTGNSKALVRFWKEEPGECKKRTN